MKIRLKPETSEESCEIVVGGPCGYVIFGASGDLTGRKLIPAVFSLFRAGKVPDNFFIVGFARSEMDDDAFRKRVEESIEHADENLSSSVREDFIARCFYVSGEYDQNDGYQRLREKLEKLSREFHTENNLIFHIATPPKLYGTIVTLLGKNNLVKRGRNDKPFQRVIVEKPFGHDLESAALLDEELREYLSEEQIYRIDHYLGKETVQNILMFRFANQIFESTWNNHHIDHIQITVAEEIGVGHRAGYFEQAGLLRDMFQNHMMQLTALIGMEPPIDFSADSVRDEKIKFMKSIRPFALDSLETQLVMGQYATGKDSEGNLTAYREEKGVKETSCTETYFAMKLLVDNWRWKDVPFYLQAGKRLEKKLTRIAVIFKKIPYLMFSEDLEGPAPSPNVLIFEIQPRQCTSLLLRAKVPGSKMCLEPLRMELDYREAFGTGMDEDYSTLILDCINGDQTLFWRRDGVEASWKLLTPVLQQWETATQAEKENMLKMYDAGSWGPAAAARFIEKDRRRWIID